MDSKHSIIKGLPVYTTLFCSKNVRSFCTAKTSIAKASHIFSKQDAPYILNGLTS